MKNLINPNNKLKSSHSCHLNHSFQPYPLTSNHYSVQLHWKIKFKRYKKINSPRLDTLEHSVVELGTQSLELLPFSTISKRETSL